MLTKNRGVYMNKLKVGEQGHMSDLVLGQRARILGVHNENKALRRRMLDMGITKGVEIEIKKIAPLKDPIDIQIRGYELCLRKSDIENIDIEVIE